MKKTLILHQKIAPEFDTKLYRIKSSVPKSRFHKMLFCCIKVFVIRYVKVFNGCADIFLRKWESIDDGRPVEIYKDVSCLTLDAMLKCSISCDTGCQNQGYVFQSHTL